MGDGDGADGMEQAALAAQLPAPVVPTSEIVVERRPDGEVLTLGPGYSGYAVLPTPLRPVRVRDEAEDLSGERPSVSE